MWLESNCNHIHDVDDNDSNDNIDNNDNSDNNGDNGGNCDNGGNGNTNYINESSTSLWLHRWLFKSHNNTKKKKHNSTTSHNTHNRNKISKRIWYICHVFFLLSYIRDFIVFILLLSQCVQCM